MTPRYELLSKIASGGMGTVYVGRASGAAGFHRLVAIKRAHPHLLEDPETRKALMAEARLVAHIHHANVVAVVDVVEHKGELLLVMEYVDGVSLAQLRVAARRAEIALKPDVAVRILLDACSGLSAAHHSSDDDGRPLCIIHRDVSPHNLLVGSDGVTKISDFGIAKALSEGATTSSGLKGKLGYMAPEYLTRSRASVQSDVFALGVVAWELLAGKRLFGAPDSSSLDLPAPRISSVVPGLGAFDEAIARALAEAPGDRYASVAELATALEAAARSEDRIASPARVGGLVRELVGGLLEDRRRRVREAEAPGAARDGGDRDTATMDVPGALPSASETLARLARSATPASAPFVGDPRGRRSRVVWIALALLLAGGAVASGVALYAQRSPRAVETREDGLLPSATPPTAAAVVAPQPSSEPAGVAPTMATTPDAALAPSPASASAPPAHPARVKPRATAVKTAASAAPVAPNPYKTKAAP